MRFKEKLKNLKNRNWSNYGSIVLTFVAFIAMFSHCLVGPLLLPFVSALFPLSSSSHHLCWLVTGITSLFSVTLGVILAEKFYDQCEARKEEGSASGFLHEKKAVTTTAANEPLSQRALRKYKSIESTERHSDEQPHAHKGHHFSTRLK